MPETILIVEDDQLVANVCRAALTSRGYTCEVAQNGAEGLERFERLQPGIKLVLTDVRMPVMNGVDMIRKIWAIAPETCVILMTGYNDADLVPSEIEKLCTILDKPFGSKVLGDSVVRCLQECHQSPRWLEAIRAGSP